MVVRRHPSPAFLILLAMFLLAGAPWALRWAFHRGLPAWRARPYRPLIAETAAPLRVDPRLVESLIWRESRFDPDRRGEAGEFGLMQIRPDAMRDYCRVRRIPPFDPADLADPATNLAVGVWYLARALDRWSDRDDPRPYALAEYNAGLVHARRWAGGSGRTSAAAFQSRIDFPTTRRYIDEILGRLDE